MQPPASIQSPLQLHPGTTHASGNLLPFDSVAGATPAHCVIRAYGTVYPNAQHRSVVDWLGSKLSLRRGIVMQRVDDCKTDATARTSGSRPAVPPRTYARPPTVSGTQFRGHVLPRSSARLRFSPAQPGRSSARERSVRAWVSSCSCAECTSFRDRSLEGQNEWEMPQSIPPNAFLTTSANAILRASAVRVPVFSSTRASGDNPLTGSRLWG